MAVNKEQTFCYVGTKPCGHTVAAIVDQPEYKSDIARETGKWLRAGWKVDRVPVEDARILLNFCDCDKKKRRSPKQPRLSL